jgi:hypothetical protein
MEIHRRWRDCSQDPPCQGDDGGRHQSSDELAPRQQLGAQPVQAPHRTVIDIKRRSEIRTLLTRSVNAHTDARRRRRRFKVGRVLVLNNPPA